jgi:hypothetical protein
MLFLLSSDLPPASFPAVDAGVPSPNGLPCKAR